MRRIEFADGASRAVLGTIRRRVVVLEQRRSASKRAIEELWAPVALGGDDRAPVMSARHQRPDGAWVLCGGGAETFGDEVLAAAILDRLLHDAEVLSISGPSFRLKGRLEALGQ